MRRRAGERRGRPAARGGAGSAACGVRCGRRAARRAGVHRRSTADSAVCGRQRRGAVDSAACRSAPQKHGGQCRGEADSVGARQAASRAEADRPDAGRELTALPLHGLLRTVTDTDVRLWRRVHMDLVRYAGCVCHPSL
ncbi:putative leader peptide [Streptomyces sp. NRRL S-1521]|uniref:putative leader peptide n=1 Tax=Streptomyces sp. NRRL S-1521 TaxID=1609100 RepID=UPI003B63EF7D